MLNAQVDVLQLLPYPQGRYLVNLIVVRWYQVISGQVVGTTYWVHLAVGFIFCRLLTGHLETRGRINNCTCSKQTCTRAIHPAPPAALLLTWIYHRANRAFHSTANPSPPRHRGSIPGRCILPLLISIIPYHQHPTDVMAEMGTSWSKVTFAGLLASLAALHKANAVTYNVMPGGNSADAVYDLSEALALAGPGDS